MSTAAYLSWAALAPKFARQVGRPRSLNEALRASPTLQLAYELDLPPDAVGWLAGVTLKATSTHPELFKPSEDGESALPLLYVWATRAPDLSSAKRVHINESRFRRWLTSYNWEDFYRHSIEMLLVLRGDSFRLADLYDIARGRTRYEADEYAKPGFDTFRGRAMLMFYNHQPRWIDATPPPYTPIEELLSGPEPDSRPDPWERHTQSGRRDD